VHYRLNTVKTKEPRVISTIEVVNLNIHTHLKFEKKVTGFLIHASMYLYYAVLCCIKEYVLLGNIDQIYVKIYYRLLNFEKKVD